MNTADPKSFDQYLKEHDIKLTLASWFKLHPDLKQQVDTHLDRGAAAAHLYDWLSTQHSYPLARTSIIRYATIRKAGGK